MIKNCIRSGARGGLRLELRVEAAKDDDVEVGLRIGEREE